MTSPQPCSKNNCESCQEGFHLDGLFCKAKCDCRNGTPFDEICDPASSRWVGQTSWNYTNLNIFYQNQNNFFAEPTLPLYKNVNLATKISHSTQKQKDVSKTPATAQMAKRNQLVQGTDKLSAGHVMMATT